ncbi:MAG TPA: ferredoxin [Kiloniellales bacterium]|nr:ferredoxin [Kiloniellales bacterium]
MDFAFLCSALEEVGLHSRGAFHPQEKDAVPLLADGAVVQTLVLVGAVGGSLWRAFAEAPEYRDGRAHPLDRWSLRVISQLARAQGAQAVFPFGGPPHHPFLRWARRAEGLSPAPLGLLIHPRHGLWHSYRGALLFQEKLQLPEAVQEESPCLSCSGQPCLSACPVGAFDGRVYDVDACASHLRGDVEEACANAGCLARMACPVAADDRYPEAQRRFHISAFLKSRT